MKDPRESASESSDDAQLRELLAPLAQLQPSASGQLYNRAAIAEELQKAIAAERNRKIAWWRRRVSLPWPVAACLLAMALAGPAFSLRSEANKKPAARTAAEVYQNETYLCGIGRLKTESGYILRSQGND